ncbi:MAG: hypothetical protein V4621_08265 [Pseudomonadota bacterium]
MSRKTLITPQQNREFHGLLTKAGISEPEEKAALVKAFSAAGHTSSKELLMTEATAIIGHLKFATGGHQDAPDARDPLTRMRNKLLSLAHEMRWEVAGKKVDLDRLMKWVAAQGVKREKLNDLTRPELNQLVTQLQIVNEKRLAGLLGK